MNLAAQSRSWMSQGESIGLGLTDSGCAIPQFGGAVWGLQRDPDCLAFGGEGPAGDCGTGCQCSSACACGGCGGDKCNASSTLTRRRAKLAALRAEGVSRLTEEERDPGRGGADWPKTPEEKQVAAVVSKYLLGLGMDSVSTRSFTFKAVNYLTQVLEFGRPVRIDIDGALVNLAQIERLVGLTREQGGQLRKLVSGSAVDVEPLSVLWTELRRVVGEGFPVFDSYETATGGPGDSWPFPVPKGWRHDTHTEWDCIGDQVTRTEWVCYDRNNCHPKGRCEPVMLEDQQRWFCRCIPAGQPWPPPEPVPVPVPPPVPVPIPPLPFYPIPDGPRPEPKPQPQPDGPLIPIPVVIAVGVVLAVALVWWLAPWALAIAARVAATRGARILAPG